MTTSPWAWMALLGGAIFVAAVALCYHEEEEQTVDPFAGAPLPKKALVMR